MNKMKELVVRDEGFWNTREASQYLRMAPQTLRKWRCTGGGPAFVRMGTRPGARCRYKPEDVRAWAENRTFESTSQADLAFSARTATKEA